MDRIADGREDDVETVTFGSNLGASVFTDEAADQRPVADEEVRRLRSTTGFDESRIAAKIRKEEAAGDRTDGAAIR